MSAEPGAPGAARRSRRGYLDWMRGLAVLIMIEAHLLDSWTGGPDRQAREFVHAMILGGIGAPLFLFLAGVAVALSAGSKARRTGDAGAASRAVMRRGLEIFGLAFLFRLQAVILSWGPWPGMLKVDILNIMGPSIVAAAALWGAARTTRTRLWLCAAAAVAIPLVTPIVRMTGWLALLPDPVEAYIRPVQPYSSFVLFPWMAFVFAGAVLGIVLDATRTREEETRVNTWCVAAGAALALGAYGASYLPSPYERSDFWTSSPSFFFLRLGLMAAAVGLAYAWQRRPGGTVKWSPVEQLGRTSLFIYWIHVELVYGLITRPLHKSMTLPEATLALAGFALLMLACSMLKTRLTQRTA